MQSSRRLLQAFGFVTTAFITGCSAKNPCERACDFLLECSADSCTPAEECDFEAICGAECVLDSTCEEAIGAVVGQSNETTACIQRCAQAATDGGTPDADGSVPDWCGEIALRERPEPAGVLFVIDDSSSMLETQGRLSSAIGRLVAVLDTSVEYHFMVTSTDLDTPTGRTAGTALAAYSSSPPFEVLGFDLASCTSAGSGHACARGGEVFSSRSGAAELERALTVELAVGNCGSGAERGIGAAIRALEQAVPDGCNMGFFRPEGNVVIVVVSDEEDSGSEAAAAAHRALVNALAGEADRLRLAVIAGAVDGEPARCRPEADTTCGSLCEMAPTGSSLSCDTTCPGTEVCFQGRCVAPEYRYWESCEWCSYYAAGDCCSALPGGRYVELARLIGTSAQEADRTLPPGDCRSRGLRSACLVESVCQTDLGDTLERIGRELVATKKVDAVVSLDPPLPPSARVYLGDRELQAGVDYQLAAGRASLTLTTPVPTPAPPLRIRCD